MLSPNDQRKVNYCKENNNGICPFVHKICDGLCNNCGLNESKVENYGRIAPARNYYCNDDYESLIHYDTEE